MDKELVARAARGDHEAYTSIVQTVLGQFHGIAYNILRDSYLAEDAVQAALIAIWRDLPRLREPGAFSAWSKRVLLNACYSEARKRQRIVASISDHAGAATMDETVDGRAGGELQTVIDRDQLERGFRYLTVEQRAVVVLHYYLDLRDEQAAEILDIPVGTYKSRLHRTTKALRAWFDADQRAADQQTPGAEAVR